MPENFGAPLEGIMNDCGNYDELFYNAAALTGTLSECIAVPTWIKYNVLDDLRTAIDSKPAELKEPCTDLHMALANYKDSLDEVQSSLNLILVQVVKHVESDTKIRDFVSTISNGNRDEQKLSKYCSFVKEAQTTADLFTKNIGECTNSFRNQIAPKIDDIVKAANVGSDDGTKIGDVTNSIEAQIKFADDQLDAALLKFEQCTVKSSKQCESDLAGVLTKIHNAYDN